MKSTAQRSATVFTNGWIYTGVNRRPHWGGLIVAEGKIVTLDSEAVRDAEGRDARVVDLDGRMLLPGFQDAHVHPVAAGVELLGCDLSESASGAEVLSTISAFAEAHPELEWITGGGWSMNAFAGGRPTRQQLDAVVGDRPILLENRDHHSAWANTRAFELAGIGRDTGDPADGRIEREIDGYPAGTVHDGAIFLFDHVRPKVGEERAYAGLLAAQSRLLEYGVTAWQDAAVGALMGLPDSLPLYLRALAEGDLHCRVRGAQWWNRSAGVSQLEELRNRMAEVSARFDRASFSLGAVKMMVDGVAESRTASMHGHYRDATGSDLPGHGISFFESGELAEYVTAIDAAGMQVHFHSLGDRAVTDALDALAAARSANGDSGLRHHLAHLQVVRKDDLPRFAELSASANLQAFWAAHDAQLDELVIPFLPRGAEASLYPFADLEAAGASLAMGSDWPVSSANPLEAIAVGVNRRHRDSSGPALSAEQSLSLESLLMAYTSGSAHVNHFEERSGYLRDGFDADLVILDKNLFELDPADIATAVVDETWISGECVYTRGGC